MLQGRIRSTVWTTLVQFHGETPRRPGFSADPTGTFSLTSTHPCRIQILQSGLLTTSFNWSRPIKKAAQVHICFFIFLYVSLLFVCNCCTFTCIPTEKLYISSNYFQQSLLANSLEFLIVLHFRLLLNK